LKGEGGGWISEMQYRYSINDVQGKIKKKRKDEIERKK